jgi:hypothetical protein
MTKVVDIPEPQPCPWCHEPVRLCGADAGLYTICCVCGAQGPDKVYRPDAIEAWNRVAMRFRKTKVVRGPIHHDPRLGDIRHWTPG